MLSQLQVAGLVLSKVKSLTPAATSISGPQAASPCTAPARWSTWVSPAQPQVWVMFQLLHQLLLRGLLQDVPARRGEGSQGAEEEGPGPSGSSDPASERDRAPETCDRAARQGLGTRDSDPPCLQGALKSTGEHPSVLAAGTGQIAQDNTVNGLGGRWAARHWAVPRVTNPFLPYRGTKLPRATCPRHQQDHLETGRACSARVGEVCTRGPGSRP